MVSTVHQLQHPTENEGKERFQEGLLQAHEQLSVWETMENIGKHKDINLVTNQEAYLKRVMKPSFNLEYDLART